MNAPPINPINPISISLLSLPRHRQFLPYIPAIIGGACALMGVFWHWMGNTQLSIAYAIFVGLSFVLFFANRSGLPPKQITYLAILIGYFCVYGVSVLSWNMSIITIIYVPALAVGSIMLQGRRLATIVSVVSLLTIPFIPFLADKFDSGFRLSPIAKTYYEISHSLSILIIISLLSYVNDQISAILVGNLLDNKSELEATQEKLIRTQHYRNRFFSSISHEIRTPMNAVRGISMLLSQKNNLSGEEAELVQSLQRSSTHLLSIINELLDLSKLESDKLQFQRQPFDLKQAINDACVIVHYAAAEKQLVFEQSLVGLPDRPLVGDVNRLRQILVNILNNAVKFTEKGSVTLHCSFENSPQNPNQGTLYISVRDTGVGIAPSVQQEIFGDYAQGGAEIAQRFGGTGLGLHITKKIVTKLGGDVSFTSIQGQGSTFFVQLPYALYDEEEVETLDEINNPGPSSELKVSRLFSNPDLPRILMIVDDNQLNTMVAQRLLSKRFPHTQFLLANNGQNALDLLHAREATNDALPDVILMDLYMPVMDGLEASRHIREHPNTQIASIPIIAMTANISTENMQKCTDAGMNDFIGKPFDVRDLAAKINNHTVKMPPPGSP